MAVVAAQVGLVVGTLYGSNFYLNRVAEYNSNNQEGQSSSFASTTTTLDDHQENSNSSSSDAIMGTICQDLLDMLPPPPPSSSNNDTTFSTLHHDDESMEYKIDMKYESWDPRGKVMESLLNAIQNCRKQQQVSNKMQKKI